MKTTEVVSGFVMRGEELLVLQRSDRVGSYRGCWAGVSGYLECDDALEQMYRELQEELSVDRSLLSLQATGAILEARDGDRIWRIHPFLFELSTSADVVLDWEHNCYRWIRPEQMHQLDTVPSLWEAYCAVAPSEESG